MAAAATAAAAALLAAGVRPAGPALLADASPAVTDSVSAVPNSTVLQSFSQFTVSGTAEAGGGPFGGDVTVSFDGVIAGFVETDADDGSFSMTLPVPIGDGGSSPAHCGANTVVVTEDGDDEFEDFEVGTATINLGCAAISVSPSLVGQQQLPATFAVTPQNFPQPGGFTLTVDGTPQAFTTAPGAALDFTGSPSCGTHQVTLSQTSDEQLISASAQVTVDCPRITLTPSSIPLASEPATVTVTGAQFHASQPVSITLDGTTVGSAMTDEDGNFTAPITARGLDCAAHRVTVTEQATGGGPAFLFSASVSLRVTGCKLTLAIDPAVLEPGQVTRVAATGFAPGVPVTLTWQQPGGAPLIGRQTATAGAGGNLGAFFLVLPGDLTGARDLVATQGRVKLTASALVQASPTQPVPGGQLIYRQ